MWINKNLRNPHARPTSPSPYSAHSCAILVNKDAKRHRTEKGERKEADLKPHQVFLFITLIKSGGRQMAVEKTIGSTSLAEVIDRILDKGIVVDAWIRVSLVGIELLAIEARVVVAGVDTFLKYAEAVGLTASAAAPA